MCQSKNTHRSLRYIGGYKTLINSLNIVTKLQQNRRYDLNNNVNHISRCSVWQWSLTIYNAVFLGLPVYKIKDNTTLHVLFQGNIYLGSCSGCCKRWFITFNGAECSGPLPIDAILWIRNSNTDDHRHGSIDGYCDNIRKGNIRVGINIGNCPGYGNSDGYTGYKSVSRLIIEEVPRSQQ